MIALANQKGGVGKTTTAISLAAGLASANVRTLLVDLDPQGNATTGLGRVRAGDGAGTYGALLGESSPASMVTTTDVPGLDLLPSGTDLAGAEIELVSESRREFRLREVLSGIRRAYDLVVVDCPPSLGLLTVNALVAADAVLVPIQCEYYALEGVGQLLQTIELVRAGLHQDLHVLGVVLTMYDARTKLAQQVASEVRQFFGAQAFRTVVPRTVRLSEAPSYGQPITVYDPTGRGARAYERLAREVAQRVGVSLAPASRATLSVASAPTSSPDQIGARRPRPVPAAARRRDARPVPAAERPDRQDRP